MKNQNPLWAIFLFIFVILIWVGYFLACISIVVAIALSIFWFGSQFRLLICGTTKEKADATKKLMLAVPALLLLTGLGLYVFVCLPRQAISAFAHSKGDVIELTETAYVALDQKAYGALCGEKVWVESQGPAYPAHDEDQNDMANEGRIVSVAQDTQCKIIDVGYSHGGVFVHANILTGAFAGQECWIRSQDVKKTAS